MIKNPESIFLLSVNLRKTPWHVRDVLDAISYAGPEFTTIYVTMGDGFTHRVKVWW